MAMRLPDPKNYAQQAWLAAAILGLGLEFDSKDVEAAYRRTSRTVHPDVCSGPEAKRLFSLATDSREYLLKVLARIERQVQQPITPNIATHIFTYQTWTTTGS